jgi:hypothetical protein
MNGSTPRYRAAIEFRLRLPGFGEACIEETSIITGVDPRQQRLDRGGDVADRGYIDGMAAA